jgi:hypothetical protein
MSVNEIGKTAIDESRIENATRGLARAWSKNLKSVGSNNANIICDYIDAQYTEINPAKYYRRDCISWFIYLSKHK